MLMNTDTYYMKIPMQHYPQLATHMPFTPQWATRCSCVTCLTMFKMFSLQNTASQVPTLTRIPTIENTNNIHLIEPKLCPWLTCRQSHASKKIKFNDYIYICYILVKIMKVIFLTLSNTRGYFVQVIAFRWGPPVNFQRVFLQYIILSLMIG